MVEFTATIHKYGQQGDKTGWTYVIIPPDMAEKLLPNNKKSFRVKGRLDELVVNGMALMPVGGGSFMLPLNATIRKAIHKKHGATLVLKLQVDTMEIKPPAEFVECLKDEPVAHDYYFSLSKSHQLYFTRWISSAKTEPTKTKRIAQAVNALAKGFDFGTMLRAIKKDRDELTGR